MSEDKFPVLALHAAADRTLLPHEVPSSRFLEWVLKAQRRDTGSVRAPLNIALVIDRSGSMSDSGKLDYVRQAALHVLQHLTAADRVAVVAYDDAVRLVGQSRLLTPSVHDELKQAIRTLSPGGSTDLHGGWLRGVEQVAAHQSANAVNRVLLLTDGLANHGETDPERIVHQAQELWRRGIVTSTFGVGQSFNEHLLRPMAEKSGGNYHYIDRADRIPALFREELGELLSVVAQEALLEILVPGGFDVRMLGGIPHERTEGRVRVPLGEVCSGEERRIYAEFLTPPGRESSVQPLRSRLTWAVCNETEACETETVFTYVNAAAAEASACDTALQSRAYEVRAAERIEEALRLDKAGDHAMAMHMLSETVAMCAPAMAPAAAAHLEEVEADMARGLSEEKRKFFDLASYHTRRSKR